MRKTAMGGAGLLILKNSRSAFGAPANEQIGVALIGCGGRGSSFVNEEHPWDDVTRMGARIVAMCDVNGQRASWAFNKLPDVPKWDDYREMFDKAAKDIDAVIVATTDHSHAPASSAALRAGKPVYCEKPLTRTVYESRRLAELARERKLVTQMGNQGGYAVKAVNLVWGGVLGAVSETHCWCAGNGAGNRPLPQGAHPIPETLEWDLWLGPAAYRDYHPSWMNWLMWRDFGTSMLGNRGSHTMATAFKALKIGALWPRGATGEPAAAGRPLVRVSAECSELCKHSYPRWERIRWDVPEREDMGRTTVYWHFGNLTEQGVRKTVEGLVEKKLDLGDANETWKDWVGTVFKGEKGVMHCGQSSFEGLLPKDKFEDVQVPDLLPKPLGQPGPRGWLNGMRGGPEPMCSFDGFSGPYIEFQNLAHVATLFPGETLEFDPVSCRIVNNSEADAALRPPYREGWVL